MLLFGLLLLNANYLQVVRAEDLHNDSRQPAADRRGVLPQRGPILVGGKPVACSVETDDRLKYLRQYSDGQLYAPATGFYSLVYGATRHRAARRTRSWPAPTTASSSAGSSTCSPACSPRAAASRSP